MTEQPWYERAFLEEYLQIYAHRSPAQGRAQVAQMLDAGILPREGRVLDLCCGTGRHLLPMREAGLNAFGLDLSMALLRFGRLAGLAVGADARRIPYVDSSFDCVANLFSSFGYFPDDAAHREVLSEVVRVLMPGGRFVIDHMNAEVTIANLRPETRDELDGGVLHQQRRYDEDNRRVIKEIAYTPPGEDTRNWYESVRVFDPGELDEFLTTAGFQIKHRFGDLDGSEFDESTSPRQVVVAES